MSIRRHNARALKVFSTFLALQFDLALASGALAQDLSISTHKIVLFGPRTREKSPIPSSYPVGRCLVCSNPVKYFCMFMVNVTFEQLFCVGSDVYGSF